jgi:hypothetical protein
VIVHVLGPGLTMATVEQVLAQLGPDVTEEMLRSWARRRGVRRVLMGGEWWYHLEASIEAEFETRTSGRGRPRRADPPAG